MVARMLSTLVVLHTVLIPGSCCRKKEQRSVTSYYVYPNDTLPADLQVTAWLHKGESKRFFYTSPTNQGSLTLTLTTCSSPILWSFTLNNTTDTTLLNRSMNTYPIPPAKGVYILHLTSLKENTYVQIYVSTEPGGPQALQNAKYSKVRLVKRQKGKRLTVKWHPSLVDPQGTDYCLVVTSRPPLSSFCALQHQKNSTIICKGRKTHHTLTDLKQGQKYYFSIFATNHQSNFTYPYGSTAAVFDGHFRHTSLKDGKLTFANLRKLDGKAVFRYKVGENVNGSLDLFILPCGGVVDVEVTLNDTTVVPTKRVKSFGKFKIEKPVLGARYYIKVFAWNREDLKKSSGVEVYATTRLRTKIPLPNMPQIIKVKEYKGLTTCDSVTVGWMTVPGQNNGHYCLSAKEGRIREDEEYRVPNQCGLENRLRKSVDFTVKFCMDITKEQEPVITRKINQLKPGRYYIIQVTVKKPKGKTLSYDLLQVRTKPSCKKKN